jgi:chromosome segregation ATPase
MKNFLQNLLIFLALCLCGLIALQWHRETLLRQEAQARTDTIHDKAEAIQGLQGTLRQTEEEVKRLDALKKELTETVRSNRTEIASLRKDLDKANTELDRGLKQTEAFKTALQQANENIKKQNEDIRKQNEDMKNLAAERNESVAKYNKVVEEFNDLAKKWNDQQQSLSKTNPPASK